MIWPQSTMYYLRHDPPVANLVYRPRRHSESSQFIPSRLMPAHCCQPPHRPRRSRRGRGLTCQPLTHHQTPRAWQAELGSTSSSLLSQRQTHWIETISFGWLAGWLHTLTKRSQNLKQPHPVRQPCRAWATGAMAADVQLAPSDRS